MCITEDHVARGYCVDGVAKRRRDDQGLHHDRAVRPGCVVCGASSVEGPCEPQAIP